MTTDRVSEPSVPSSTSIGDILLDGLFAGTIGALAVALWFLLLDAIAGRPLYTPALLGGVLLQGSSPVAWEVTIAPLPIAVYTAFHFVVFIAFGVLASYLMSLFEQFPI